MPKAAKSFVVGNKMVLAGEDFEIPQGEEAEFREGGLIAGEEPQASGVQAQAENAPAGTVGVVPEPLEPGADASGEPAAGEDESETKARKRR